MRVKRTMVPQRAMLLLALSALLTVYGCGDKKKTGEAKGATTSAGKSGGATKAAPQSAYPQLETAIREVATQLTNKTCQPRSANRCANYKEAAKLLDRKNKGFEALETMAQLLSDEDPAVATIAAWLFYEGGMRDIGRALRAASKDKSRLAPASVDALIAGLAKLDGYAATRVTTVAAWSAALSGKIDALMKVAETNKNPAVAARIITQLMRYGRLEAFAKIQDYAKSDNARRVHAALKAPLNMHKWTDAERAKICPWGQTFLGHATLKLAAQAGHLMVRCKADGKYIEALLAEGKKRVKAGQWKMPFDFPYRDICFGGFLGRDKKPAQPLCDKTYAFLKSVTDNKKVDANMRARALDWIVYQRRDQKSYDLLKKYKKHKVKEIAKVAADGMKMLKRK